MLESRRHGPTSDGEEHGDTALRADTGHRRRTHSAQSSTDHPSRWRGLRRALHALTTRAHVAIPVLATTVVSAWGITRPSLWRDEIITWAASTRTLGELARTLNDVDVVFAPYYLFMHVWTSLFGASHLALRLPSLLATVATAAVIALIGERTHSRGAGLAAGMLFAAVPTASRFAQEARPYSFATLFVGLATLLLLRALDEPSARRWTACAVAYTLAGWSHLFAASVLLGHGLAVVALARRGDDRRRRGWLLSAIAATVAIAPLAVLGSQQTGQVAWLGLTTWQTLPDYLTRLVGVAIVTGIVIGLGTVGFGLGRDRTSAWVLGATATVPFTSLFLIGAVKPLFHFRYALFVVALWVVLAGIALARAPRPAAVAALATILLFSATVHVNQRRPDGHSDGGLDSAASLIAAEQQPGDAIVLQNAGWLRLGMDYYLPRDNRPRDVYLARSPGQRGSYTGAECAEPAACLGATNRIWIVCLKKPANPLDCLDSAKAAPIRGTYTPGETTIHGAFSVTLYTGAASGE